MLKVGHAICWQVGALVIAIVLAILLSRFLPIVSFIEASQQRVMSWGTWGAVCYPLLFAACNATAVSFALSRWIARRWFQQKLSHNATLRALGPAVERESWKIILLSQLHPLFPTSLLNYFYGITRIPFGSYMFWASVGRAPGLFLYVYAGTLGQFAVRIMRGKSYPRMIEYWIWGGAFVTTALLLIVLGRMAHAALRTSHNSTGPKQEANTEYLNINS